MNVLKKMSYALVLIIFFFSSSFGDDKINYANFVESIKDGVRTSDNRKDLKLSDPAGRIYVKNKNILLSAKFLSAVKEPAILPENQLFRMVVSNWYFSHKSFAIFEGHKIKSKLEFKYRFYVKDDNAELYKLHSQGIAPGFINERELQQFFKSSESEYLSSWTYRQRIAGDLELGVTKLFTLEFQKEGKINVIDMHASSLKDMSVDAVGFDLKHVQSILKFDDVLRGIVSSYGYLKLP